MADEEVAALFERIAAWPPTDGMRDADLRTLVDAAKDALASGPIRKGVELVLCRHAMSFALRPVVMMLFHGVDAQVRQHEAQAAGSAPC